MFGLVLEMLESLPLAVSEDFETNWWGDGGAIFFSVKANRRFSEGVRMWGGLGWGTFIVWGT
jgi:hypothetical protein